MLALDAVSVRYGPLVAVREVSFALEEGRVLALVGLNGAGKTSLVRAIAGLVPIASGAIRFEGRRIDGLPRHAVRGLGIVPEGRLLAPTLTVAETLRLGAGRLARRVYAEREEEILARLPVLAPLLDRRAGTLSGGQAQMLALARALIAHPRLLVLDEPTMGLSPAAGAEILALLADLKAAGATMLVVDQGIGAVLAIADEALVMSGGTIAARAAAAEIRARPEFVDLLFAD